MPAFDVDGVFIRGGKPIPEAIEAMKVLDSRDWASDQQIILDLMMSKNGRLGTRSETFEEGPLVFFSHNDVV